MAKLHFPRVLCETLAPFALIELDYHSDARVLLQEPVTKFHRPEAESIGRRR
jgi:hypothetical protein